MEDTEKNEISDEEIELQEEDDSMICKNLLSEFTIASRLSVGIKSNEPTKECMKVYLRVRPFSEEELKKNESQGCLETEEDEKAVVMHAPQDSFTFKNSARGCGEMSHRYTFSRVYGPQIGQKDFFDNTTLPLVKDFVDGQNCLVYTYGVTNSGKTYTIQGNPKDGGILPRTLDVLFNSIEDRQYPRMNLKPKCFSDVIKLTDREEHAEQQRKVACLSVYDKEIIDLTNLLNLDSSGPTESKKPSLSSSINSKGHNGSLDQEQDCTRIADSTSISVDAQGPVRFSVWVSFTEIYNELIYDLLEPCPEGKGKKRKTLKLGDDKNGNPYVKDLKEIEVSNADEAYKILKIGKKNQRVASTKLNQNSSRSHCIFTVKVLRVVEVENPHVARISRLSFVDLAGSERYSKTQSSDERLKEAGNINTSLMTLGKCMEYLRHNQLNPPNNQLLIPFRESKLTRLFQGFFSGKGKAAMVVNISQNASVFDETCHVLRFSAIAKQVKTRVSKLLDRPCLLPPPKPIIPQHMPRPSYLPTPRKTIEVIVEDAESPSEDTKKYETLMEHVKLLEQQLRQERQNAILQEFRIREEVCNEMSEQIVKIENDYSDRLREEQIFTEEKYERKMELLTMSMKKTRKRPRVDRYEDEEDEWVSSMLLHAEETKNKEKDLVIENLSSENDALKKEIAKLKEALLEDEKHSKAQEEAFKELQDILEASSEELRIAKSKMEERDNKILVVQEMLEESNGKITKLEESLASITTQLETSKSTASKYEEQSKTISASLEAEKQDGEKRHEQMKAKVLELENKIMKCEEELRQSELISEGKDEKISTLTYNIDEHKTALCDSEAFVEQLNRQVRDLKRQVEMKGSSNMIFHDASVQTGGAQTSEDRTEIHVLETRLDASMDEVSSLKMEIANLNSAKRQVDDRALRMEEDVEEKEKYLEEMKKSKDGVITRQGDELMALKALLQQEKDMVQQKEKLLLEKSKSLPAEDELEKMKSSFEIQIKELKVQVEEAQVKIAEYVEVVNEREACIRDIALKYEKVSSDLEIAESSVESTETAVKKEINLLKEALGSSEKKVKEFEELLVKKEEALKELQLEIKKESLDAQEKMANDKKKEVNSLHISMKEMETKVSKYEKEFDSKQDVISELEKTVVQLKSEVVAVKDEKERVHELYLKNSESQLVELKEQLTVKQNMICELEKMAVQLKNEVVAVKNEKEKEHELNLKNSGSQVTKLKEQLIVSNNALEKKNSQVVMKNNKIKEFENSLKEAQDNLAQKEKQLKDSERSKEECKRLKRKVDNVGKELEEANKLNAENEKKITDLSKKTKEFEKMIEESQKMRKKMAKKEKELEESSERIVKQQNEIESLKKCVDELKETSSADKDTVQKELLTLKVTLGEIKLIKCNQEESIKSLEEKVQTAESNSTTLSSEVDRLKEEITKKESYIEQVQQQLADTVANKETIIAEVDKNIHMKESDLKERDSWISELKTQLVDGSGRQKMQEYRIQELESKLEMSEDEVARGKLKIKELHEEIESAEQGSHIHDTKLKHLQVEMEQKTQEIILLKTTITALQGSETSNTDECDQLRLENQTLNQRIESRDKNIDELEENLSSARKELLTVQKTLKHVETQLENSKTQAKEEADQLKCKISELESLIKEKTEVMEQLGTGTADSEKIIEQMRGVLEEQEGVMAGQENLLDEKQAEIDSITTEVNVIGNQNRRLDKEVEKHKDEISVLEEEKKKLQQEITESQRLVVKLEVGNQELKNTFEKDTNDLKTELKKVKDELESKMSLIKDLEADNSHADHDKESHHQHVKEESAVESKSVNVELEKLKLEKLSLMSKVEGLEDELTKMEKDIEKANNDKDSAMKALRDGLSIMKTKKDAYEVKMKEVNDSWKEEKALYEEKLQKMMTCNSQQHDVPASSRDKLTSDLLAQRIKSENELGEMELKLKKVKKANESNVNDLQKALASALKERDEVLKKVQEKEEKEQEAGVTPSGHIEIDVTPTVGRIRRSRTAKSAAKTRLHRNSSDLTLSEIKLQLTGACSKRAAENNNSDDEFTPSSLRKPKVARKSTRSTTRGCARVSCSSESSDVSADVSFKETPLATMSETDENTNPIGNSSNEDKKPSGRKRILGKLTESVTNLVNPDKPSSPRPEKKKMKKLFKKDDISLPCQFESENSAATSVPESPVHKVQNLMTRQLRSRTVKGRK